MGDVTKLIYHNCPICYKCGTSGFCKDQDTFVKHILNHPWLVGNHNVEDCADCQNTLKILKLIVETIIDNNKRIKQKLSSREYLFVFTLHTERIFFTIPAKRGHYF